MKAPEPPSGELWLHEIKHDGFRVIARKDGLKVRLYSRPGNDLTYRFPLIVESLARLRSRSCILDGEAVCCGDDGVPRFDRIRYRRYDASVFLYAFDLTASARVRLLLFGGSKADSEVPRITSELRLLTFEYPGERYAWPCESASRHPISAGLINSRCPCHSADAP